MSLLYEALVDNPEWKNYVAVDTDTDHNGDISEREVEEKFKTYIDVVFTILDNNTDGRLTQPEVESPRLSLAQVRQLWGIAAENYPLKNWFSQLDANGNGLIDRPDFRLLGCGRRRGYRCSHHNSNLWLLYGKYAMAADRDGDQHVTLEELRDKVSEMLGVIFNIADTNNDTVIALDDVDNLGYDVKDWNGAF